jgi:hypothetical protein
MLMAQGKDGGGVALASPGSPWGWAADLLACNACLQPSAKMKEGSVVLALLGFVCSACIGAGPLMRQLVLCAPSPG